MDPQRQVPVPYRRFFPLEAIGPVENPLCLYWLKVIYIILGGFSLGMSFTLMFASIPKEPLRVILFTNLGAGAGLYIIVHLSDTIPLIPLFIGRFSLPLLESLVFFNLFASTLNIHNRLKKDDDFKPVFSLQSMCLGMSLALYTARFQEWLRLVPPGQAPPPQNGNVHRPAAAGAQAGQNVDGSSAAGDQPLQNVGAAPAQLQNEYDPLLEDEDNAVDQLAVEREVAAPSDYAAFEIEN